MSVSLSSIQRYLITFVFMAVCIYVWYHYAYAPLVHRIDCVQEQTDTVRSDDLTEKIETLQKELTPSDAAVHEDQLDTILGYLDRAGMMLDHGARQDKQLYVQATGSYPQCLLFFDAIASSSSRMLAQNLRITRATDNQFSVSFIVG